MTYHKIDKVGDKGAGKMGKRDELNELAMKAAELRRQNMTVATIALFLGLPEVKVWRLLARARKLWSLLADASDSNTLIGENLSIFEALERLALEKFARVNPSSNVAVAYLNAAISARMQIKKLLQESGLMTRVPEKIQITTDLPLHKPEVMAAAVNLIKALNEKEKS